MKREVLEKFYNKYYLLGKDDYGKKYYLEHPDWCDTHWSFGIIVTFNHCNPELANDIETSQHATDFYPRCVLHDESILKETPFSQRELFLLAELFKEFYLFDELWKLYRIGSAGITTIYPSYKNKSKAEEMKKQVKTIIDKIVALVSPNVKVHEKVFQDYNEYINKFLPDQRYRVIEDKALPEGKHWAKYIDLTEL